VQTSIKVKYEADGVALWHDLSRGVVEPMPEGVVCEAVEPYLADHPGGVPAGGEQGVRAIGRVTYGRFSLEDHAATELPEPLRSEAQALLLSRLPLNRALIPRLMTPGARAFCHRAHAMVPVPPHRALIVTEGERCVGVCLVQNVAPARRQHAASGFSQVLMLAVHEGQERRRIGRTLVSYLKVRSAAAG
jgi:hypothetical protein